MRTGGKLVGVLTLLADIGKGSLAVGLAIMFNLGEPTVAAVALASFLGHIFPIYLKFKGGKGVATMFGVLIPWQPLVAAIAFAIWLIAMKISRYVSLSSILAGCTLPVAAFLLGTSMYCFFATFALGVLMIGRHSSNILRLLNGTEPKTGQPKPAELQQQ